MASKKPQSLGYIVFESYTGGYSFECLLGDGSPVVTAGYGGWQVTPRAKRRGLTEWNGNDPLAIDIPILFDGWAAGKIVEAPIGQLEKMAGLEKGMNEPPLVTFDSHGVVPHDATNASQLDWVIEGIQWGDADRNSNGDRLRQAATVTVRQHIEDDSLNLDSPANRRKKKKKQQQKKGKAQRGAKHKRYVVKAGETLEQIAAKELGSSHRWRELRDLNPRFRDPKKHLPAGTIIRLP